jgi:ABC-type sugar transport system ATPase subunit
MIKINGLSKEFGKFMLKNISFNVKKGDLCLITGHNGAGKTLLLETIAGFWKPDKGQIIINNKDVTYLSPEIRGLGFMYQDLWLFPHLSVRENILYSLEIRGVNKTEKQKKLDELNELIGLQKIINRKNVSLLSGGERQKISLARALASNPEILLMDEPTHMLDKENRELFYRLLAKLKGEKTIIYIEHVHPDIEKFSDMELTIKNGELINAIS